MSKITFATKGENNERREKEFLALTPSQRVMHFLKMASQIKRFETRASGKDKGNFIVQKKV